MVGLGRSGLALQALLVGLFLLWGGLGKRVGGQLMLCVKIHQCLFVKIFFAICSKFSD
jgi:hypothetical protein